MKTPACVAVGLIAFTFGLTLELTLGQAASAQPSPSTGRRLAAARCGTCHAVGRQGDSPNPRSPRFRDLGPRYPFDGLHEALAQGMIVGHPQLMPRPALTRSEVDDLIAYMRALQRQPGRRARLRSAG